MTINADAPSKASPGQATVPSTVGDPPLYRTIAYHLIALPRDKRTWRTIIYLLSKLPIGIATFVTTVTLVTTSLALTFAPAYAWANNDDDWAPGGWDIDTYPWPFALVPAGLLVAAVSRPIINAMATFSVAWTQQSIDRPEPMAITGGGRGSAASSPG